MDRWPFEDPENVATLTTRQVVKDGEPILNVFHYADDGMWQFSTAAAFEEADAMVVSLRDIFEIDPSIGELAGLPPGWQASRQGPGEPWQRQMSE
jgi:hypothetical protein